MTKKTDIQYLRREFLNAEDYHSIASIYAHVVNEDGFRDVTLIISDCKHTVELELDTWCVEDCTNSLEKLEKIKTVSAELQREISKIQRRLLKKEQIKKPQAEK